MFCSAFLFLITFILLYTLRECLKNIANTEIHIGKLYLGLIFLANPGSTQSTLIHLGVLLIYLQVPRYTPGLLWSKPEPASRSGSMFKYSNRIWVFVWVFDLYLALLWFTPEPVYWFGSLSKYSDRILPRSNLCSSQLIDLGLCLSTRTRSCLALIYARASFLIWIFAWEFGLDLALHWSMPELTTRSRSLVKWLNTRTWYFAVPQHLTRKVIIDRKEYYSIVMSELFYYH